MGDILSTVAALLLVWVVPVFAMWTVVCTLHMGLVAFSPLGLAAALGWAWCVLITFALACLDNMYKEVPF